jgi:DNA-binding transcriptional ArsR family regulator
MKESDAVAELAALAHETRLRVFRILVQAGHEGVAAGRLASQLGLAAPTLSFHLAQLAHANLATARRVGRSIIYAANYPAINRLLSYLTENCCGGRPEICLPVQFASASCAPVRRPCTGAHESKAANAATRR